MGGPPEWDGAGRRALGRDVGLRASPRAARRARLPRDAGAGRRIRAGLVLLPPRHAVEPRRRAPDVVSPPPHRLRGWVEPRHGRAHRRSGDRVPSRSPLQRHGLQPASLACAGATPSDPSRPCHVSRRGFPPLAPALFPAGMRQSRHDRPLLHRRPRRSPRAAAPRARAGAARPAPPARPRRVPRPGGAGAHRSLAADPQLRPLRRRHLLHRVPQHPGGAERGGRLSRAQLSAWPAPTPCSTTCAPSAGGWRSASASSHAPSPPWSSPAVLDGRLRGRASPDPSADDVADRDAAPGAAPSPAVGPAPACICAADRWRGPPAQAPCSTRLRRQLPGIDIVETGGDGAAWAAPVLALPPDGRPHPPALPVTAATAADAARALLNGQPGDPALREFFGGQIRRLLARAGQIDPGCAGRGAGRRARTWASRRRPASARRRSSTSSRRRGCAVAAGRTSPSI